MLRSCAIASILACQLGSASAQPLPPVDNVSTECHYTGEVIGDAATDDGFFFIECSPSATELPALPEGCMWNLYSNQDQTQWDWEPDCQEPDAAPTPITQCAWNLYSNPQRTSYWYELDCWDANSWLQPVTPPAPVPAPKPDNSWR